MFYATSTEHTYPLLNPQLEFRNVRLEGKTHITTERFAIVSWRDKAMVGVDWRVYEACSITLLHERRMRNVFELTTTDEAGIGWNIATRLRASGIPNLSPRFLSRGTLTNGTFNCVGSTQVTDVSHELEQKAISGQFILNIFTEIRRVPASIPHWISHGYIRHREQTTQDS